MKSFILKILGCSLLIGLFAYLTFYQADGKTDALYGKFSSPIQNSLIIGASRAAQGLVPNIIDSVSGRSGLYNFAMTLSNSPYGPAYYENICKKLDPESTGGYFILFVSPWALSATSTNPNDSIQFREQNIAISNLNNINTHPNIPYLIKAYDGSYIDLWFPKSGPMFLNDNGWLEVTLDMDESIVAERTESKISNYKSKIQANQYSDLRFSYLKKTIDILANHGDVFLVRMPISSEMNAIEDEFMPEFNAKIKALAVEKNIAYFNLISGFKNPVFTDGNHLEQHAAKKSSLALGKMILETPKMRGSEVK